ncbi:hypothetical protein OF83DRAFT_324162 [Amylostereum chailletii]|nr:hypothetical protein OF83DRAFT_324162 [Amylostereum chailletii]
MSLVSNTPRFPDISDLPSTANRDKQEPRFRFPFPVDKAAAKPWVLHIIDSFQYDDPPMVDGVLSLPAYDPNQNFVALFDAEFIPLFVSDPEKDDKTGNKTTIQSDKDDKGDEGNDREKDKAGCGGIADKEDDVEYGGEGRPMDEANEANTIDAKPKVDPELQKLKDDVYRTALYNAVDYIRNGTINLEVFNMWTRRAFTMPFIVVKLSVIPRRTDILPRAYHNYTRKMTDRKAGPPGKYSRSYMHWVHVVEARKRVSPLRNEVTFGEEDAEVHANNHGTTYPHAGPTGTVALNAYQSVELEIALLDNRFQEYRVLVNNRLRAKAASSSRVFDQEMANAVRWIDPLLESSAGSRQLDARLSKPCLLSVTCLHCSILAVSQLHIGYTIPL